MCDEPLRSASLGTGCRVDRSLECELERVETAKDTGKGEFARRVECRQVDTGPWVWGENRRVRSRAIPMLWTSEHDKEEVPRLSVVTSCRGQRFLERRKKHMAQGGEVVDQDSRNVENTG